jgi:hypothetical protein
VGTRTLAVEHHTDTGILPAGAGAGAEATGRREVAPGFGLLLRRRRLRWAECHPWWSF